MKGRIVEELGSGKLDLNFKKLIILIFQMVGESKINGPSIPSFPNRPIYRLNLDLYKSSLKMISALDKILVKVLLLIKE